MGRHTRLAPTTKKPDDCPPKEDIAPSMDVDAVLAEQMVFLCALQDSAIVTINDGKANPALLRESAGLVRSIVSVAAEMRTREKHATAMMGALKPEQVHALVAEHIRSLDHDGQKYFAELFAELEGEGGLLA